MVSSGNRRSTVYVSLLVRQEVRKVFFTDQHHSDITNQEHGYSIVQNVSHFCLLWLYHHPVYAQWPGCVNHKTQYWSSTTVILNHWATVCYWVAGTSWTKTPILYFPVSPVLVMRHCSHSVLRIRAGCWTVRRSQCPLPTFGTTFPHSPWWSLDWSDSTKSGGVSGSIGKWGRPTLNDPPSTAWDLTAPS